MQTDQISEWTTLTRSSYFQSLVQEVVQPITLVVLVHSFQNYQEQVEEPYYIFCSFISFGFLVQLLSFSSQREVLISFCDSISRSFSTMKHYLHILSEICGSILHFESCCFQSFTVLNQRMDCAAEAFQLTLSQQYLVDEALICLTQFQLVLLESQYGGHEKIL